MMADETELVRLLRLFEATYEQTRGMPWIGTVRPEQAFKRAADTIEALQREGDRLRAAGWAAVRANTAARNMVPDDDEGLAAKVFCYHINVADNELRAALSGEAS